MYNHFELLRLSEKNRLKYYNTLIEGMMSTISLFLLSIIHFIGIRATRDYTRYKYR